MDKSTFDRINTYCDQNHKITQTERDFVIRKFLESQLNAIEAKEIQKGAPLTPKERSDIEDALLNNISLESTVIAAKSYYTSLEERFFSQFKKNTNSSTFWNSVWTNIAANIIYSIFLIIVFFVAKDQISSWLDSLKN